MAYDDGFCSGASSSTPDLIPVTAGGSSTLRRHNSMRAQNSNSAAPATVVSSESAACRLLICSAACKVSSVANSQWYCYMLIISLDTSVTEFRNRVMFGWVFAKNDNHCVTFVASNTFLAFNTDWISISDYYVFFLDYTGIYRKHNDTYCWYLLHENSLLTKNLVISLSEENEAAQMSVQCLGCDE